MFCRPLRCPCVPPSAYHVAMEWAKLGDAVRARREELQLTQLDVQRRGGPSPALLSSLENNRADTLTPSSRRGLELSLSWRPRTIDRILEGGEVGEQPSAEELQPSMRKVMDSPGWTGGALADQRGPTRTGVLGIAVKNRRIELGMTLKEVAAAGGPSDTTLAGIENGAAVKLSPSTLRKLDQGLQWKPGRAREIYGTAHISHAEVSQSRHPSRAYGVEPNEIDQKDMVELLIDAGHVYRALVAIAAGERTAEALLDPAAKLHRAVMNVGSSYFGGQEEFDDYVRTSPALDLSTPRNPDAAVELVRGIGPSVM